MQLIHSAQRASVLFIAAIFAAGASAQTIVYPAKGQSADQQKKDEGECHTWAVGQSKYDPANPPPPPATAKPPTTATGTTPGAGARGAARGAVVGEIVADDAGTGAQWGGGRARPGRHQNNRQRSSSNRPPRNSNRRAWPRTRRRAPPASKGAATRSSRSPRQRVDRAAAGARL